MVDFGSSLTALWTRIHPLFHLILYNLTFLHVGSLSSPIARSKGGTRGNGYGGQAGSHKPSKIA